MQRDVVSEYNLKTENVCYLKYGSISFSIFLENTFQHMQLFILKNFFILNIFIQIKQLKT